MTLSHRTLSGRTRTQSGDLAQVSGMSGTRLTRLLPSQEPVTPSLRPHPSNGYHWTISLAQGKMGRWRGSTQGLGLVTGGS